jgi:hypothetical protein
MGEPDAESKGASAATSETSETNASESRHETRLQLVLDVFVFQFKLAADGLRDVLLVPLSIISGIMGLIAGGEDPYKHFRQLLNFGRRTEIWINLFGHRKRSGTSDELIAPIKDRVMSEAQKNPWISKAGDGLNRGLDSVEEKIRSAGTEDSQNDR